MNEGSNVRDDLRFVRQASRPGSFEARQVHGCTCVEDLDRERVWNPEDVASWQADVDLACPAHGRLLELYIEHVNATLGRSAAESRAAVERAVGEHERARIAGEKRRASRRSFSARVQDAWRGMVQGWRGGAV
jgi:hypothetical protein